MNVLHNNNFLTYNIILPLFHFLNVNYLTKVSLFTYPF